MVLSVSSSSLCLGRAAACDCGTPWTFLLSFLSSFFYLYTIRIALYYTVSFSFTYVIDQPQFELNKPSHGNGTVIAYAIGNYSGEHAHSRSLARTYVVRPSKR